jgi:hypothetical protein
MAKIRNFVDFEHHEIPHEKEKVIPLIKIIKNGHD